MRNKIYKLLLIPVISLVMLLGATLSASSAFAALSRQPYLQNVSDTQVVVRWRTTAATSSRVSYGPTLGSLNARVDVAGSRREHEVVITGLTPNSKYFYSVGATSGTIEAGNDAEHYFTTAPNVGSNQKIRIWAIGDPGTGTANQRNVRNAYYNLDNVETNVVLTLGDNAYNDGTDREYTNNFFNVYNGLFRHAPVWATRGNHERNLSVHETAFTHPTQAEAGGIASGSELYYSFDYGNIHFVCLDSFTSSNLNGSAMYTWLENDLASTTQKWIIAFWHHPPYSRSSAHDSNTEAGQRVTRQRANPILERYGVDLQLGGHNHFYSRTFLINNHYGLSGSYNTATHAVDGGNGRADGDGEYQKGANPEGAVYVLAGSSGKTGYTPRRHPANFTEVVRLGSMVIDVDGDRMDVRMLRENGAIQDYFSITKAPVDTTPPAVPSGLTAVAGDGSVSLDWADNSEGNFANYNVKRSTTLGGPYTTIATSTVSAYNDTGLSNGTTYYYVVSAVNTSGNESVDSTQASATPVAAPADSVDLVVDVLSANPLMLQAGGVLSFTVRTTNQGTQASVAGTYTDLVLSSDTLIDGMDRKLRNVWVPPLAAGAFSEKARSVTLPADVAPGDYYFGALVDRADRVAESDEGNNTGTGPQISVQGSTANGPDLVVNALSATPSALQPGDVLTFTVRTENQGTQATTQGVYTRLVLSSDTLIDGTDRKLRSVWVPRLAAGAFSEKTRSVTLPADVVADSYFIGAIVDRADQVAETDEGNNTQVGSPLITVQ